MLFSSTLFLFLFLPVVLSGYFLLPWRMRNLGLLAASLLFYAWGEPRYVLLMLLSICVNYAFAPLVERRRATPAGKRILAAAITVNLGLLAVFKYGNFLADNLNVLLDWLGMPRVQIEPIALPIGISFYTFHAITYVVDVYRRQAKAQRNPIIAALYISLFPQLIAGPIIRYHTIAAQLVSRTVTIEGFAHGVRRFTIGLAKKVLIANTLAVTADKVFALPSDGLTPALAWMGIVCYTLQIYVDFSGYSDMAIGLGGLFGFRFPENFNYPYTAQSLRDFWRRWHISLSTWFRDYLYIPLGGSRRGHLRTMVNLVTVFFLCGLWHGASWVFVVWGLYHGFFLALERTRLGQWIAVMPRGLRHGYAVFVVLVGWVFFRANTLERALGFLSALAGLAAGDPARYPIESCCDRLTILALMIGVLGSTPLVPRLATGYHDFCLHVAASRRYALSAGMALVEPFVVLGLLVLCGMWLSASTHNPFIYFRF